MAGTEGCWQLRPHESSLRAKLHSSRDISISLPYEADTKQWQIFSWAPKSLRMVTAAMKLRHSLLGRKVITNLDSVLKSRDITLPTKVCIVKAMVFPVVVYGCESWTIKKAERGRIDAFKLWCWRRLLRVPWTTRSNQSILKEINPEYSLEGLMLKLNTLATGCTEPTDWKSL